MTKDDKKTYVRKNFNNFAKEIPENFGLGVTSGGRLSWDNDDQTARELRGKTIEDVEKYVANHLFNIGFNNMSLLFKMEYSQIFEEWTIENLNLFLQRRYKRFNNGLRRAYLGTLLRKARERKNKEPKKVLFGKPKQKTEG